MPRIPSIVVIGSSNTDLVIRCARLPKPGETLSGGEFARHAGGKGANQAVAAARAGARVAFVGAHGADDFGREAKRALKKEGIDARRFRECPGASSGLALILLGGRSKENMIAVARSANDFVTPEDVAAASGLISRADAVVCQLEIPPDAVMAAAKAAQDHRVPFILNPAPFRKFPRGLLRMVHVLTPNEREAKELTGCKKVSDAVAKLHDWGCENVVITLGARGAWVSDTNGHQRIAAPHVEPLDTVGAGDCFTAWLAVGIAGGMPIVAAAERAVQAAAISVTRLGAQDGMPWRAEVPGER